MSSNYQTVSILGFSGSLRKESLNKKAVTAALRIASEMGARSSEIDLKDLNIPVYNADDAQIATPEGVQRLVNLILETDVILIASPEYNYSIPGGLKNVIDWISKSGNPFDGKLVVLMGVSNGAYGTIRMQPHLREVMFALNALVIPQPQILIRDGNNAFTPDGGFLNPIYVKQIKTLLGKAFILAGSVREANNAADQFVR